jgi:anaerobic ribonucleoside-triphosphate reductase activating protein
MRYANIILDDTANGEGVRVSLFVSGCNRHCKGCFNQDAQNFEYGELYTPKTEKLILTQLDLPYVAGLSILGGEPLDQTIEGKYDLLHLIAKVKNIGKTVWLWTGYTWKDVVKKNSLIMRYLINWVDVVVDGPYIEELRDISLPFRGSSNQRIIDVKRTLDAGRVVLYSKYYDEVNAYD